MNNIIKNFTDFIIDCFNILDTEETYNKSELIAKLQDKYNNNKEKNNLKLKPNTIKI